MNERYTEDIVRSHFKSDPLFSISKFEEQKSANRQIDYLLQAASKSGKGVGKPEFIVSFPSGSMDYLIIIECKALCSSHRSKGLDKPKDYAVDGVVHYGRHLAKDFNVIAIAVSGQTKEDLLVSHFLFKKGKTSPTEIKEDRMLRSINDYLKLFNNEHFSDNLKAVNIIQRAIYLNELYQSYSVTETTRCTMVSAILLALIYEPFRVSYGKYDTSLKLAKAIISAIDNVLVENSVKSKDSMIGEYNKILNEPLFTQKTIKHKSNKDKEESITVNKEIISYLHRNLYPLLDMEQSGFDVLGRFYTEFIRYAGSEQSQGLVLTPAHITDLFCDLAKVNTNSVIYDPCCGTGGFLIAGMKRMLQLAGSDEKKKRAIKSSQLIGVELRPSMFTYACSNMMLRGDGKSNIYRDDCFNVVEGVKKNHAPTIAFLNPPYDVGTDGQLGFVEHALDVVSPQNGTVVAIVQMSCAIKSEKELVAIKKRILEKHRLVAALSMPDDLFYPVGVVTSVMVFKANEKSEGKKTWFGYFKNDGFEKRKQKGRIDARGRWGDIKKEWLSAYYNSEEILGLSVKKEITADDEWCAEAYMATDYSSLGDLCFEKKINEYMAFQFLNKDQICPS